MRRVFRFLGFAGLVLFLFGLVSYVLTGLFDAWTAFHLAGGGALLAAGIAVNFAGVRRTISSRGAMERAMAAVGAVVFCGILAGVNVLAARHSWRWDATERKIHTLSPRTLAALAGLGRPVEFLVFSSSGDPAREEARALLERYAAATPKVTWRLVDPEREPDVADRFGVRRQGVVVARAGTEEARSTGDPGAAVGEGSLTNLLLRVTRAGPRTVYLLSGHGEAAAGDADDPEGGAGLARLLADEGFEARPLLLTAGAGVPSDAALVVVAGPRKPLLPPEVEELRAHARKGGRLLILADPGVDPGLTPLLADHRLALADDMIVDPQQIPFLGTRLGLDPIVEDFETHPITRHFKERIVLFEARSVEAMPSGGLPGATSRVLARTRPSSTGVADYRGMLASGRVSPSAADRAGPLPVAAAAWIETGEDAGSGEPARGARLVALGDSDLARNAHIGDFFNAEFLLNAVRWLTGNEDLVAEAPRGFRPSRLEMTEADYRTLFRFGVLFLPEVFMIAGLGIWWRRRGL